MSSWEYGNDYKMRILLLNVCVHTEMLGSLGLEDDFPSNNKGWLMIQNTDFFNY